MHIRPDRAAIQLRLGPERKSFHDRYAQQRSTIRSRDRFFSPPTLDPFMHRPDSEGLRCVTISWCFSSVVYTIGLLQTFKTRLQDMPSVYSRELVEALFSTPVTTPAICPEDAGA
jgi:hypothetical protein